MPSRPRPPQRRSTDTRGLRLIVATLAALTLAPACVDDPGEPDSNHDNLGETHSSLTTANGLTMNGLGANGIGVNGITLNGIDLNGIHLNGIHLNGIHLNGIHLNGIHLNGIDLFGTVMAALDATSQAAVERSLVYMARCALSPGQTMTYYTLAGTTRTVTGVSGLDPTWLDGVPNLGKADVVATCVQNLAISAGDTVTVELTDLLNFKKVLQYLVECALPQGHSITYYDETDLPVTVAGSLGLAPEWEASTPTAAGQRYVSACLAARTNANGQTVRISLRGPSLTAGAPSPLSASDTERASFNWNEGAFWGDLFSATPSIKTCVGQGNGVAGRLCTVDGTCGFTNVGQCSQPSVCATQNPGDGAYTGCLGTAEVVSTYLPIGTSTASGTAHTCVRKNDGQIVCHGQNGLGQLGDGTTTDQLLAAVAPLLPSVPFLEVVGSQTSAYGRTADGALYGWGQNHLVPSRIAAAGVVSALSSGGSFLPQNPNNICVLRADGTVACQAADSRLGPGALVERTELGAEVARVAASNHACALKSTGDLYCWGSNQRGQVGDGTTVDVATAVKVASTVTDLALGASHTCVRTIDQRLWCWGDNGYGQLGNNVTSPVPALRPTMVLLTRSVTPALRGLAAGVASTCTLTTQGTVWCWGRNLEGEVGDGSFVTKQLPVPVTGLASRVVALEPGPNQYCARFADDRMACWGSNYAGGLGDGTLIDRSRPVASTLVDLRPQACGDGTCAPGESSANCPADCGSRVGDFACNGGETPRTAPADCGIAGDGLCTAGEDCGTNPNDCGVCSIATGFSVASVSLSPTTAKGGTTHPTGTVTLTAAAPSGGTVVALQSSLTTAATVPATVTVAAGATQASFVVTTKVVSKTKSVTITASYPSTVAKTATLSVTR